MRRLLALLIAGGLPLTMAACGGTTGGSGAGAASGLFVVTTDYETGSFATEDAGGNAAVNLGTIHSDAAASTHGGLVYVVNRLGADNVQVLDPAAGFATVRQFSVGSGANPHEIAFASDTKAYVSRNSLTSLLIVNPSTGAELGTIDLAAYADADGLPEMSQLAIRNGKLYVAVQNLDQNGYWTPVGTSRVVVVDTATDTVTGAIDLPYQNPTGPFFDLDGKLAVACVGNFGATDGGIAVIDTATDTATAAGPTEAQLGGDIGPVVMTGSGSGMALVTDASFNTALVRFSGSGSSVATVLATDGYQLTCAASDGTTVWICDRTAAAPGLRGYAADGSEAFGLVSTGLPPAGITRY